MSGLAQILTEKLQAAGWATRLTDDLLVAEKEVILSKWLLGSRRVKHEIRLRLNDAMRELGFQEISKETVIGMPPPVFSFSVTRQKGMEVTEDRVDTGVGGGSLHYGEPRKSIEQECARAGWTFRLKIGSP